MLWGALAALPTGFTSLYDWVVGQLAGKLGNSGNQTLNGELRVKGKMIVEEQATGDELGFVTGGGSWGVLTMDKVINIPSVDDNNQTFALLSQIYTAVQQIAPAFTAKAYALNDLCTYNGVVYHCKSAYTATSSSAKPNSDTTHWEAKKVSELFLPLTGGTISEELELELKNDLFVRGDGDIILMDGDFILPHGCIQIGVDGGGILPVYNSSRALLALRFVSDINSPLESVLYMDNSPIMTQASLAAVVAPQYSTSESYDIGDFVRYDGRLWRFIETHLPGPWASGEVEIPSVADSFAYFIDKLYTSPALTGTPTAPTPTTGDNSTKVATTAFVQDNIPYSLGTPTVISTASSETVEGETVNYGAATLANRTANVVQVTAATALDELRITFPAATSGKVRDFGLRVEIGTGSAALTAPALVLIAPTGETIKLENNAAEIPALADGTATAKGVTLLYFSETAPGVFVVKGEQVEEVA